MSQSPEDPEDHLSTQEFERLSQEEKIQFLAKGFLDMLMYEANSAGLKKAVERLQSEGATSELSSVDWQALVEHLNVETSQEQKEAKEHTWRWQSEPPVIRPTGGSINPLMLAVSKFLDTHPEAREAYEACLKESGVREDQHGEKTPPLSACTIKALKDTLQK